VIALVAAFRAWLWLLHGNLVAAYRWAQASCPAPTDEPEFEPESGRITLPWVLIAQEKPEEALSVQ
jgi:hypothetical protein